MKPRWTTLATALVIAATTLMVPSPPAEACLNEMRLQHDEAVKRIAQIEFHLRYEQHWFADQAMPPHLHYLEDRAIQNRMFDAEALLKLRYHKRGAGEAERWFFGRVWDEPRSPKLRAWLAEASEATGQATYGGDQPAVGTTRALEILRDLDRRDLIPDGRAYAVLARLTYGEEWVKAREKCHARALVKSVCEDWTRSPPIEI